MTEWLQWIADMLGAERYSQHAICLTNDPLIMTMYVSANMSTGIAYFIMGGTLFARRYRAIVLQPQARGLYGAFIFLCGLYHFSSVLTMFFGVYRLDVLIAAAMAAVSVVTAVVTTKELIDAS
jgi:hypothetical protein